MQFNEKGYYLTLLLYGLFAAVSERGFYGMACLLALFATIAIQKNVRDSNVAA